MLKLKTNKKPMLNIPSFNLDGKLKNNLDNIEFLVFDELHVYKGRQGADVSLLNRRIKAAARNKNVICIKINVIFVLVMK